MALIDIIENGELIFLKESQNAALTKYLNKQYDSAEPFPSIIIDDFLPIDFADKILNAFPDKNQSSVHFTSSHQLNKRGYRPDHLNTNPCRAYLYLFNSQPFLSLVEQITGINGLIPDPYFEGAGLHEIDTEGKLNIHTDFNFQKKLNLIRKVNVLIYLNKNWKPEYGGNLELWDYELKNCVQSIAPVFNRCVIFNTDKKSMHGHPTPLNCPAIMSRKSISVYYYVAPDINQLNHPIDTKPEWKIRPGSNDKIQKGRTSVFARLASKLKTINN